jgi:hypothetical protein
LKDDKAQGAQKLGREAFGTLLQVRESDEMPPSERQKGRRIHDTAPSGHCMLYVCDFQITALISVSMPGGKYSQVIFSRLERSFFILPEEQAR